MDDAEPTTDLSTLLQVVEQLDSLADTAELMGDADGAVRFREAASRQRLRAMDILDD